MTHHSEPFIEQCHAYFDGLLSSEEERQFLKHLEDNQDDFQHFQAFQAVHQALQAHTLIDPSPNLAGRIGHAIEKEALRPKSNVIWANFTQTRYRAAAAILIAGVVVGVLTFQSGIMNTTPSNPTETTATIIGNNRNISDAQLEVDMEETWQSLDNVSRQKVSAPEETSFAQSDTLDPSLTETD